MGGCTGSKLGPKDGLKRHGSKRSSLRIRSPFKKHSKQERSLSLPTPGSQLSETSSNSVEVVDNSNLKKRLIKSSSIPNNEQTKPQISAATASSHNDDWWTIPTDIKHDSENDATTSNSKYQPKNGDCYIFNYQKFEDGSPSRPGSEKDVIRLEHTFEHLNFNVHSDFKDLSKEQTKHILKQAAKHDHTKSKCFVCFFLTHGEDGKVSTSDGYLNVDEILACFSRSACKSLAGKPKIFVFQDCGNYSCGEEVHGSVSNVKNPDFLDFLLLYSTYEGRTSREDEDETNSHGSFYINELCRTLEQFSGDTDLLQILNTLNYRVENFRLSHLEEEDIDGKKYLPGFTSSLTTELNINSEDISIEKFESDDTKYFDQRRKTFSNSGSRSTTKPSEDKKIYEIDNSKRIKCLLLLNTENHIDDTKTLWKLTTARDYQSSGLSKWSKKELMDYLNEVKARGLTNTDCLICFVVCKAEGKYLCDADGKKFLKKNIVEQFNGKECPALEGKPKIFIFLVFSSTKQTWSCFFSDIAAINEDRQFPLHCDLLGVTITVQEIKQLKDVIRKWCYVFGRDSSGDFLSQLTKINKQLNADNELEAVSKSSSNRNSEAVSSVIRIPKKEKSFMRRLQTFPVSRKLAQSNRLPESSKSEESEIPNKNSTTMCFNSTLTKILKLSKQVNTIVTENNKTFQETNI